MDGGNTLDRENTVSVTFRLNLSIPEHELIYRTLSNLDNNLYKSKSSFIIDALEKYIKGITPEMLMGVYEDKDFITREDINDLKEELREELTRTITKDVTRNMYSGFAAAFMKDSTVGEVKESQVMELD